MLEGSPERLIGTVSKNRKERIQLSLTEYHGRDMLNLRVWYLDDSDAWKPGKQGLALRVELLPELLRLLHQAEFVAQELHLLSAPPRPPSAATEEEAIARRSEALGRCVFGSPKRQGGGQ